MFLYLSYILSPYAFVYGHVNNHVVVKEVFYIPLGLVGSFNSSHC